MKEADKVIARNNELRVEIKELRDKMERMIFDIETKQIELLDNQRLVIELLSK